MNQKAFALGALAFSLFAGHAASAANIFIVPARGADLSSQQQERITGMVRRSVENMPEHKLVMSEAEADFILRPAVVRRDNGPVLRIEKSKENELIAVAEQPLDMASSSANAQAVTQTALQIDSYVGQRSGQRDVAQNAPAKRGGSRNPAQYDDSVSGATSAAGPATNLAPTADTTDTRSLHNPPAEGSRSNLAESYTAPDQMSGRDRQVIPEDSMREPAASDSSPSLQQAFQQQQNDPRNNPPADSGRYDSRSEQIVPESNAQASSEATDVAPQSTATPNQGGEVRGPSPKLANAQVPGFFQMGFGPSFAIGLNSDNIMYNVNGAYNYNVSERVTAKGFADFNIGTGADSAQFVNIGGGAELYPENMPTFGGAKPYVQGDLGYGFARSGRNLVKNSVDTGDGITIGAGAGFKFEASDLNWDIAAHYAVLTSQVDERTPSVLGIRAALNF